MKLKIIFLILFSSIISSCGISYLQNQLKQKYYSKKDKEYDFKDQYGNQSIELCDKNLSSLEGIEKFKELHFDNMDFNACSLDNVAPLAQFEIKTLDLTSNQLTKLSTIPKSVENLVLTDNPISSLDGINDLEKLTSLEISFENQTDLVPLQLLKKIEILKIVNSHISQFEWLHKLEHLKTIELINCTLSKNTEIHFPKEIELVALTGTKITNGLELKGLTGLVGLQIDINSDSIINYSFIESLHNLVGITISQVEAIPYINNLVNSRLNDYKVLDNRIKTWENGIYDVIIKDADNYALALHVKNGNYYFEDFHFKVERSELKSQINFTGPPLEIKEREYLTLEMGFQLLVTWNGSKDADVKKLLVDQDPFGIVFW